MNRLVLIGNGFDLAHGMPTRYEDFINWYWAYRLKELENVNSSVSNDGLCSFRIMHDNYTWAYVFHQVGMSVERLQAKQILGWINERKDLCIMSKSTFFERICKSIEGKGWVDIENEYYKLLTEYAFPAVVKPYEKGDIKQLNEQLQYLQDLLIKYLQEVEQQEKEAITSIKEAIYAPFEPSDISIYGKECLQAHVDQWAKPEEDALLNSKMALFGIESDNYMSELKAWRNKHTKIYLHTYIPACPKAFLLPNDIVFLNFNYTSTINKYLPQKSISDVNYIHGKIDKPDSVIFGYGDELDSDYKRLQNLNNNEYLRNVKSIRYLEAPNYRNILSFIESAPFQVLIMGHSCGNSDRTLLNTIFEHDNCVSIKPYYYLKEDGGDSYRELVQNISRNFTDMKLMRDRVVNKTQCEPMLKK